MESRESNTLVCFRWVLSVSIFFCFLGYAVGTYRYDNAIFTFLWHEEYLDWSEDRAKWVIFLLVGSTLVSSFLGLFRNIIYLFAVYY